MATAWSLGAWGLWLASWMLASVWSRRTVTRTVSPWHWFLTLGGWALLLHGVGDSGYNHYIGPEARTDTPLAWLLFAVVVAGLAFTWWARLHLGSLWSAGVSRKEDHRIVDTGPYALVRHPIYTGMIAASIALAAQEARATAWLGAALIALGFWIKARLEEGLLRRELGEDDYAAYSARTPMLIPLLKWRSGTTGT